MSISERLPGMRPGSTVRNLGVGVAYFFLVMMVLSAILGDEVDDEDAEATSDAAADEEEEASAAETEDEEEDATDDASEEADADDNDAETGDENGDDPPEAEDEDSEAASVDAEEESEEAEEATEESEDEAEEEAGAQITADDVEALLATNGLDVTVDETGDGVVMEYHDTVADEEELAENLGAIAGTHAGWYDEDPSIGPLTIEMYNSQTGEHAGTTSVDEEMTEAYLNDEISSYEYSYELLTGLESSG